MTEPQSHVSQLERSIRHWKFVACVLGATLILTGSAAAYLWNERDQTKNAITLTERDLIERWHAEHKKAKDKQRRPESDTSSDRQESPKQPWGGHTYQIPIPPRQVD